MDEKRKNLSLAEKLFEIKNQVSIMQKTEEGHGYKFVDELAILSKVNEMMKAFKLRLIPNFVPNTMHTEIVNYENSKGQPKTDILVTSEMTYKWEDLENGTMELNNWYMVGQQADGSQAMGSGLTYANRYFLLKYFNVATSEDDPDKIRSKMEKEEETKKLSAVQTKVKKQLEKMIQKYQTQERIYELLGTTKEEFIKNYNDTDKCKTLLEQMELIENPKKVEKNA